MRDLRSASVVRGLLSLVHAVGGTLDHRIRLQKAVYLLQRAGARDFLPATFKYHHYGPYSRALSDAIQIAVASRLLREETTERPGADMSSYTYSLTEEGHAWVIENIDEPSFASIKAHAARLNSEPWRVLELAATTLFLERDERIEQRDRALRRAIELKPACEAFRASAERLLQDMSL